MTEQGPRGRPSLKYQLAGQAQPSAGPRVLVVDDDPDMTRLIGAALSSAGVTPLAAYDALQGMIVAQRESPAVIIVDLHMPAGGGLRLLEKLKASTRTSEIPVLVITADTGPDLPGRAQELGARGFLRKPVDLVRLIEVVAPYLPPSAGSPGQPESA